MIRMQKRLRKLGRREEAVIDQIDRGSRKWYMKLQAHARNRMLHDNEQAR